MGTVRFEVPIWWRLTAAEREALRPFLKGRVLPPRLMAVTGEPGALPFRDWQRLMVRNRGARGGRRHAA